MKFIKKFKVLFAMVLLLSLAALAQMGPNFTLGNDDNGPPGDSTDLSTSEATYRLTNTVIAPLSNQLDQDLTLTVISAAPTQFETWQNPVSGAMPPDLTVSLNVNFSPSYSSGGSIVVPVDCTPDRSNPLYANFDTCGTSSTLKPLFVPLEPNTADLANMPDVADYSFDGSKITLTLMSSADAGFRPGTVTIPLKFKFELDYLRQIPNDQYMWLPTAQVYLNGSDVGNTMAAAPVKGASQNEITYSPNFMMPADPTQYTGGAINLSPTVLYNYFQQSDLDLSYQNQYYIELPTGSSSNGLRANYTGGITGVSSPIVNYNNSGYDRYYRAITSNANPSADWNFVQSGGSISSLFTQTNLTFIPNPALTTAGQTVSIRLGSDTKKINGVPVQTSATYTWTKIDQEAWNLYFNPFHGTLSLPSSICGTNNGDLGIISPYIGHTNYFHQEVTKNQGNDVITGVRYELYQNETDSRKINFDNFTIGAVRDSSDLANLPDWTQWKVEFAVKNARGGPDHTGYGGLFAPVADLSTGFSSKTFSHEELYGTDGHSGILHMMEGDYIDRVIVTAMGKDGAEDEEGQFLPRNGFYFSYRPCAWDEQVFPDGTPVPLPIYTAAMNWRFYCDDENGNPQINQGNNYETLFGYAPWAAAALISNNANSVVPGDLVNYNVIGINNKNLSIGLWPNPRIAVKVPKILVLQGFEGQQIGYSVTLHEALQDQVDVGITADVTATFTGQDAAYNYYSFQALHYNAPLRAGINSPAFIIPVVFRVIDNAEPGTYPINTGNVLVSSQDTSNFANIYGVVDASAIANYNLYGFTENDKISRSSRGNTSVTVVSAAKVLADTSISSTTTGGNFVTAQLVPVNQDSDVQVKLTLTNNSNTPVSNIKIYYILPRNGDMLGSVGNPEFMDITSTGSIKYATATQEPLQTYGQLGQDNPTLSTAIADGWTTTNPGVDTRAIFVDLGALSLFSGESTSVTLTVHTPADIYMSAYNQFRYSYLAQGATDQENANSTIAGFSTKMDSIFYNGNLPLANLNGLSNMPAPNPQAYMAGLTGEGPTGDDIFVTNAMPTLTGYTFTGWNEKADGSGTAWASGARKRFDSPSQFVLYAQWQANTYSVIYKPNTGLGTELNDQVTFGVPYLTKDADTFSRPGYTFQKWNTEMDGSGTAYPANYEFSPGYNLPANLTLYAIWTPNDDSGDIDNPTTQIYTVSYEPNAGLGSVFNDQVTFGALYLTKDADTFSQPGFTFQEWNTAADGSGTAYPANYMFTPGYNLITNLTLYAIWTPNDDSGDIDNPTPQIYTVSYEPNAGLGSVFNDQVTFGALYLTKGTDTFSRSGYTFQEWNTEMDGSGTAYPANYMFTPGYNLITNLTLYAIWTPNDDSGDIDNPTTQIYTVSYEPNAGLGSVFNDQVTFGALYLIKGTDTFSRSGYTFQEWNTAANGSGTAYPANYMFSPGYNLITGLTLYAIWTPNDDSGDIDNPTTQIYTVSYEPNAGLGSVINDQVTFGALYLTKDADTFSRSGFTFQEWNTAADGSGTAYPANYMFSPGYNLITDLTLYAIWTPDDNSGDPDNKKDTDDNNTANNNNTNSTGTYSSSASPSPAPPVAAPKPADTGLIQSPALTEILPPIEWQNPFTDVRNSDWFYSDIEYVYTHNLMLGTSATLFSPDLYVTRGMLVAILYRQAGSPDVSAMANPFSDVTADQWFADGVKWAAANGIVSGYSNSEYNPDGKLTREQLAVILYRYEQFSGQIPPDIFAAQQFGDGDSISGYAQNAVSSLQKQGLLNGGMDNLFNPQGQATRAEVAALLHRLLAAAQ